LQVVDADIPLARRTATPLRPRAARRSWLVGVGMALLVGGAGVLALQLSRPAAGPVPRPDPDGRLLGHFPYRQAPAAELVAVAPGHSLQQDAAEAWLTMQAAARADGVELVLLSAFRSRDEQKRLFFEIKSSRNQSASERARVSAPPGYSEHSTGYAVDLGDGRSPQSDLSERFEQTEAFAWLQRHAARYHFTLSFPPGNGQGVSYEPWHWRFEGTADALRVFEPAQRLSR
jgi:zinc D-Ala-D-Ala carboxypeptidase